MRLRHECEKDLRERPLLSDYVPNQLGGFTARRGQEVTSQLNRPLIGENGDITSAGDLATDGNDEEEMTMY